MKKILQKITEKAKLKPPFTEEVKEFAASILQGWMQLCADAANEGKEEVQLVKFEIGAKFGNVRLVHLVKIGLLEYLEAKTELDVIYREFVINKGSRDLQEVEPQFGDTDISTIYTDNLFGHFGSIYLCWQQK